MFALLYRNTRRLELTWGQSNLPGEPVMEKRGRLVGAGEYGCGFCAPYKGLVIRVQRWRKPSTALLTKPSGPGSKADQEDFSCPERPPLASHLHHRDHTLVCQQHPGLEIRDQQTQAIFCTTLRKSERGTGLGFQGKMMNQYWVCWVPSAHRTSV